MSKTTKAREKAKQHAAAEELILRLLGLLLDFGNFDPYWFCVSQRDLRPEHLLRDGRVCGGVVVAFIEEMAARRAATTGGPAYLQTAAPQTACVSPANMPREVPE